MDVSTLLREKGEDFKLVILTGHGGLSKKITVSDVNRPGLGFTGFLKHFPYERVQIVGMSEYVYLENLSYDNQIEILNKIFSRETAVCCILTRGLKPNSAMTKIFSALGVPLLKTELGTSSFMGDIIYYLDRKLAPSIKLHGVMTSVYGQGVLITGESAVGKSECALELVKRGHKLVADDVVVIKKCSECALIGSGIEIEKHLIEVRGIGIINVKNIFGLESILDETRLELVVKVEIWKSEREYERIGIDEYYAEFLNVKVPEITIPLGPGRNLATLVETASLNQRLKNKGYFTAKDLNDRLKEKMNNMED
ncbi:MAG: HPr(Ser) kinase/phosphatase [Endomicrobium sp.]|jgi:HPr kinase/phosphorylase|nr:HPr(Ser) kinase/phosphatase [Endomicrobium sp.]